jgi:hypothetical protein
MEERKERNLILICGFSIVIILLLYIIVIAQPPILNEKLPGYTYICTNSNIHISNFSVYKTNTNLTVEFNAYHNYINDAYWFTLSDGNYSEPKNYSVTKVVDLYKSQVKHISISIPLNANSKIYIQVIRET